MAEQQGAGNPDPDQSGDQETAAGVEAPAAPDPWEEYFSNLEPLEEGPNVQDPKLITSEILRVPKPETLTRISLYLDSILLAKGCLAKRKAERITSTNLSSKQKRRENYARVQDLWKKHPGQCTKRILIDQIIPEKPIPKDVLESYWHNIFTREIGLDLRDIEAEPLLQEVWIPVSSREIEKPIPSKRKAIGPDKITS